MIRPLGYVPVLRWRQGEYLALRRLEQEQKNLIMPLVEVLDPDYDFEEQKPKKSVDTHLEKFGKRLFETWDARPFLLDAGHMTPGVMMSDGRHPLRFMFDEAALRNVPVIPVTSMDRYLPYQAAVREIVRTGGRGVALRFRLDEMLGADFSTNAVAFLTQLGISIQDTDLILDLGAPSFDAIDDLADLVADMIGGSCLATEARSRTVLAASFPESLAGFTGVRRVKRNEWLLFKAILAKLSDTATPPAFGDYAISSTRFPHGDMRKLTVMANVRYTINDEWLVGRGKEIRVHGRSQFRGICDAIRRSDGFLAPGFSPGSQYLAECADGGSTGGSSTWNWVGINHHITKVVHDLAILSEP